MVKCLLMSPELWKLNCEIDLIFSSIPSGFVKLDKIKDPEKQSEQLEELAGQLRECKRLIIEFDREFGDQESRNLPELNKQINEKKQSLIRELNVYVVKGKMYTSSLGNKRVELFDGAGIGDPVSEDNVHMASEMSNQELLDARKMDETDQLIELSEMVVERTIEVGSQTDATFEGQAERMNPSVLNMIIHVVKKLFIMLVYDTCFMVLLISMFSTFAGFLIAEIVDPFGSDPPNLAIQSAKAQSLDRLH